MQSKFDIETIIANLPASARRKARILQERGDSLKKSQKSEPDSNFVRSQIKRDSPDHNIHVYDGMSAEAILKIVEFDMEKANETVNISRTLSSGLPADYICAFNAAAEIGLGVIAAGGTKGAFCGSPPTYVDVQTGEHETRTVALGRIVSPLLGDEEDTFIEITVKAPIDVKQRPAVMVRGTVKRRAMGVVVGIVDLTEEIVKHCSIYKGKAIKMTYDYADRQPKEDGHYHYDLEADAPTFIRTGHITLDDVILNDDIKAALAPVEVACLYRDILEAENIPTSGSALLAGDPGLGKTMYATALADACVKHDVTFMHIHDPTKLHLALRDAVLYAPCVVFCEDIDRVVGTERTVNVDDILNRMDGVDTKDKAVNCIFTTNHIDRISGPALRPGRMDAVVPFTPPDAKSTVRFLRHYGGDALAPDFDYEKVANIMAGNSPAVLNTVVNNAKYVSVVRQIKSTGVGIGDDPSLITKQQRPNVIVKGSVTTSDILNAFAAMNGHINLLNEKVALQSREVEPDIVKAARVIADRLSVSSDTTIQLTNAIDILDDVVDNIDRLTTLIKD